MAPNVKQDAIFDFIIVGAGIGGTVVASRLKQGSPSLSILLIEAGNDPSKTSLAEAITVPALVGTLRGSEVDWNYASTPQKHLNRRQLYQGGGKAIGGGSIINYGIYPEQRSEEMADEIGVWIRGDSKDYDEWANLVGDSRWSWDGFIPYFCKTDTYFDPSASSKHHGYDGPVHTASVSSSGRNYPLREPIKSAWKSLGIKEVADVNSGSSLGIAELVEARTKGQRVTAHAAYSLEGITILNSTLAKRVLISTLSDGTKFVTGIELANGRTFSASREVIICAGAIRTPQLLLLSGIGSKEELSKHGIQTIIESEEVGCNLWDHLSLLQQWRLRHPEIGASVGSPAWNDPTYMTGTPVEWNVTDLFQEKI